jgi:ankyrin repeat protein
MNKKNERRKAVTSFLLNLATNGFISKEGMVKILRDLLDIVYKMINIADKKNEVDELTENIAILFNKDIIDEVEESIDDPDEINIDGQTIVETINSLAKAKAKDFTSLSNKAIFKYMDLIEM